MTIHAVPAGGHAVASPPKVLIFFALVTPTQFQAFMRSPEAALHPQHSTIIALEPGESAVHLVHAGSLGVGASGIELVVVVLAVAGMVRMILARASDFLGQDVGMAS